MPRDIILEVRPVGVARDLRLLPRRQLGISVAKQLVGLGLEPADLRIDIDVAEVLAVSRSSATRVSSSAIGFSKSR